MRESELCFDNSIKPVDHHERSLDRLQFASTSQVSIYWYLQPCPPSLGLQLIVTLIVGLFPILNYGPLLGLNRGPLDPQSPALPSELSAIDHFSPYFVFPVIWLGGSHCKFLSDTKIICFSVKLHPLLYWGKFLMHLNLVYMSNIFKEMFLLAICQILIRF